MKLKFNPMSFLLLFFIGCIAMDKDERVFARNISLIEAYITPNFEFYEEMLVFPDYKKDSKQHTMALSEASRLLYQFRKERCDVQSFRAGLAVLFLNLKAAPFKDLSENEILTFQLWRLYRFDFFEKDVDGIRNYLLQESAATVPCTNNYQTVFVESIQTYVSMPRENASLEKEKAQENHRVLRSLLPARCNSIKANRVAYSSAFSMADVEAVKTQVASMLCLKPLTPINEALNNLRSMAQKKSNNPFELLEL